MPRVIGIDPGTVSIDICGLDDGTVFVDETIPTNEALGDPEAFVARLASFAPLDLIAGPSGYGLPLIAARDLTETDLRLAYLAAAGEAGGIGGLRSLARALAASRLPVVFTPGVIHLPSVPAHRKVNRIDMGTADKLCAVLLAIDEQAARRQCAIGEVSLIVLELGGAFTAAIAVQAGRIVDGIGGSSGPIGWRGSGALDGEVAFVAGQVSKGMLFEGGAASMPDAVAQPAYVESAVKAVAALATVAPSATDVVVSGRIAGKPAIRDALETRLRERGFSVGILRGFAHVAKHAAQGAALLADGLAGGGRAALVEHLGIREAAGTVLDHLFVISREQALQRLGLE